VAELARWAFVAFLVAAAVGDLRRLRIPNPLIAFGLAVAAAFLVAADARLWPHLAVGGAAFAVTFALFAANLIGGGDAKLFPVVALWCGPETIREFLLLLSVTAALFAIALVVVRWALARIDAHPQRWPVALRRGAGVPLAVPTLPAALPFL